MSDGFCSTTPGGQLDISPRGNLTAFLPRCALPVPDTDYPRHPRYWLSQTSQILANAITQVFPRVLMKDIDFTAVLLNMPGSCAGGFRLDRTWMLQISVTERSSNWRGFRNDHFVFLISYHLPAVEMVNRRRWSVWWWMSADGRAFDADLGPWSLSWILNTNLVRKGCPKNLPTFF